MQDAIHLPPHAASIIESMRDIGYSFPSALADIVDNSISANSSVIRIHFRWNDGNPVLAVTDHGHGMDEETLLEAMRPGTHNPLTERAEQDLGRFGLGLKTASFSQCRRLSVISKPEDGNLRGYRWDLDYIAETNSWSVQPISEVEIARLPFADEIGNGGTLVLWDKLDRLTDNTSNTGEDLFNEKLDEARDHLQLVFHRFLKPMEDEPNKSRIKIEMNGLELEPFDPFFPGSPARQMLVSETIKIDDASVHIQPFILPHHSRVSRQEYERYAGPDGYAHSQGFYLYRNRRLIDHGTWFRLVPKKEVTRLARVRVDIPNTLDHLWAIDVRKSRATPPGIIREALKRVIGRISDSAGRVYTHRGKKTTRPEAMPIWHRHKRHGEISYDINLEHPLAQEILEKLEPGTRKDIELFFKLASRNIPTDMILSDMSSNPSRIEDHEKADDDTLTAEMNKIIGAFRSVGYSSESIRTHLLLTHPYSESPKLVDQLLESGHDC